MDGFVHFILSVGEVDGKVEEAIQVVQICDDTESCTFGFLSRNIVKGGKDKFIGKFAQIIELYEYSESEAKRIKSHQNKGVASFCLLEDIPQQE